MTVNSDNKQKSSPPEKGSWLKRNLLLLIMFPLVLSITVVLFIFSEELARFEELGYLGAFLVSLTANASVLLPMPALTILFPLGAAFNPLFIGLAAGVGGSLGEMTAYLAGYSGRGIWHDNKIYLRAVEWLKKWGMLTVFFFSVTPMPIDAMGLAAGNLRFPAWKYIIACFPGKVIKYVTMAYAGQWGWDQFINSDTFKTSLIASAIAVVIVLVLIVAALLLERWDWKRK